MIDTRREEVDLQRRLSLHPNIVRFLGASFSFSRDGLPAPGSAFDGALCQQVNLPSSLPRKHPSAVGCSHRW